VLLLAGAVVVAAALAVPLEGSGAAQQAGEAAPTDVAAVLRDAGVTGNLFNLRAWGEYLHRSLDPRCKVFVDAREGIYPPQVIDDAAAIAGRGAGAADLLDRHAVEMTVMPHGWEPPPGGRGGWIPFFLNAASAVHGRAGSGNAARIAAYYKKVGVPFDAEEGFVEAPVIEAKRTWALERRLVDQSLWSIVDPLYEKIRSGEWKAAGTQVPFRVRIAEAFQKAGLLASATRELREAHRLDPSDKFSAMNLANVEITRGRRAAAKAILKEWLAAHPGDPLATRLLAAAEAAP